MVPLAATANGRGQVKEYSSGPDYGQAWYWYAFL
ncbi:hypothetical protein CCACVL1_02128 [Corchorus capsularis]|uniref:Uncharacterized protein n=1 Tax=Corchorus capsularis TaxID=210143 RepID=A0A1R3KCR2_COCAP|nr:hypothetical protein CCACVL1_02128 [Corchorus capsularis]